MRWHETKYRIYYSDTDCGGVVYYANYLKYLEIGRTELMRDAGIELEHYHNQNIFFVVVNVNINYKYSAKYNDYLTIKSMLTKLSKKSFIIKNEIYNTDDKICVSSETKCACVDNNGKLISIPELMYKKLNDII